MTKNLNSLLPEQLEELFTKVQGMRKEVLEVCDLYGYSANQLVSRHIENEIEKFYGKKLLKMKLKEFVAGCEHTDNDQVCPVCKDKELKTE